MFFSQKELVGSKSAKEVVEFFSTEVVRKHLLENMEHCEAVGVDKLTDIHAIKLRKNSLQVEQRGRKSIVTDILSTYPMKLLQVRLQFGVILRSYIIYLYDASRISYANCLAPPSLDTAVESERRRSCDCLHIRLWRR
jgi:hypothetical protein